MIMLHLRKPKLSDSQARVTGNIRRWAPQDRSVAFRRSARSHLPGSESVIIFTLVTLIQWKILERVKYSGDTQIFSSVTQFLSHNVTLAWHLVTNSWHVTSWPASAPSPRAENFSQIIADVAMTTDLLPAARKWSCPSEASRGTESSMATVLMLWARLLRRTPMMMMMMMN